MEYPVGVQTFEKIINGHKFYVDKTDLVYKLAQGDYFFLSRPRRFGKSLLISTLKAYFLGKKDLFNGLKMAELETKWETYPVFHIDLNSENYNNEDALHLKLEDYLAKWEDEYGSRPTEKTISLRFSGIIERACKKKGKKVVILIDEYDKPLTATIDNEALSEKYREELRAFYGVLKSQDQYIRFAMLTGVTKFSKVSVFSDLNQPDDISLTKQYQAICGITDEELDTYCRESVEEVAEENDTDYADMREQLRKQYDGYHFYKKGIGIYNPYSLILTFRHKDLGDYWFETATTEFLMKLLKNSNVPISALSGGRQTAQQLGGKEDFRMNPLPILYQSGYLTITGYDDDIKEYILGFPNEEVKTGFTQALIPFYLQVKQSASPFDYNGFVKDLLRGDIEHFVQRLQALFANLDYEIMGGQEHDFHNTMQIILFMLSARMRVRHTSFGRMDIEIETDDYVAIFELKIDKSTDEALRQIDEKNYAAPFATSGKKIYKIGVNFSSKTRGIEEYKII